MELTNFESFENLELNELETIDGGFVVTGTGIATGIALVGAGYAFGSWIKNKF